ncbi:DUF4153 domain-containing protein [Achromobacter xylosoxidans]
MDQADQRSLAGQPRAAPFGQGLSRTLRLAMLCLLPLAAVALYGLGLRVGQYGWTIPRVWALYCGGLLALYALGYAAALPAGFYGTLATTNLVAAFATLVLLALVQTPVADPRRIAAQSQLQGLLDCRLEPREYRYSSMRNDHGRWGRDALRQLADGAASKRDPRIAQAAASALTGKYYSWDEPKTDLIAASPTLTPCPPDGRRRTAGGNSSCSRIPTWRRLARRRAQRRPRPSSNTSETRRACCCSWTCPAAARKIWSCSRASTLPTTSTPPKVRRKRTAARRTVAGSIWAGWKRHRTQSGPAAPKRNGRWTAARSAPRPPRSAT